MSVIRSKNRDTLGVDGLDDCGVEVRDDTDAESIASKSSKSTTFPAKLSSVDTFFTSDVFTLSGQCKHEIK